jgi:pilus assembly protein Flp/PilA
MNRLTDAIAVRVALLLGALSVPSLESEEGQTLVEYALILVLIAVVAIVALTTLGKNITNVFTEISSQV